MCKRTSAIVASFFLQKLFLPLFKAGVKQQTLHMNIKKTLIKLLIKYTSIKFKKKYSKNVTKSVSLVVYYLIPKTNNCIP